MNKIINNNSNNKKINNISQNLKNKFFDINNFPVHEGILVFPISMSKISNSQSALENFKFVEFFIKKIRKPVVGANFIYSDYLYFNSNEKASVLKAKFLPLILSHKNNFFNILKRHPWYIEKSFSFTTFNQIVLDCRKFMMYLGELKKIYSNDDEFKMWLNKDFINTKKDVLDENQVNFFLEEILLFYLIAKGKVRLLNEYIQDHQKWVLICYPGKPLYSEVYLFQKNFFRLENRDNIYENCYYDLSDKKLYDYTRVELENIKFE